MKTFEQIIKEQNLIIKEFKSLRSLQKEYFKTRDLAILSQCKLQEKKVDQLLEDINKPPSLF